MKRKEINSEGHYPGSIKTHNHDRYHADHALCDPLIRAKTENSVMQALIDWTMQAVLAAEQTHDAGSGAEKKAIVTEFIKKLLIQKNISLSDEEIEMLIEAAVRQMKMEDGTVAK